jgi:transcriptional regulator with XRE-family HTH domain
VSDMIPPDDPVTAIEWGQALEFRRLAVDYSQQKLSNLIGVTRDRVNNWEGGHGLLETLKFHAAFEALGCTVMPVPTETLKALLRAKLTQGR